MSHISIDINCQVVLHHITRQSDDNFLHNTFWLIALQSSYSALQNLPHNNLHLHLEELMLTTAHLSYVKYVYS